GYGTQHALKQLRASVFCAREFMRELIARDRSRDARKLAERIFSFSLRGPGLAVFHTKDVDLFASVEPREEFGEKFVTTRYPLR
ncbi:MAG TPA: hypothetical protein VHU80_00405, partial [Polyangiaceae bacterium]|nr:hypothetical protein [Polyangiaceae bacterium]